ncbi:sugar phosphate isomerase/epimerase family protein, partial [Arthrobacter bambusae]
MTFRSHAPADVIRFAADARLKAIEWGGDVHVPAGDFVCAKEVKDRTVDAGLAVASYGSYLRLGSSPRSEQEAVVETAVALGAPRIRVWAGTRGSEDAGAHHWAAVVRDAREFADTAASADVLVGLEFHGGTLTDRAESTAALLSEIERDSRLGTYWQPPQGMPDSEALRGLDLLAGNVLAVHAF